MKVSPQPFVYRPSEQVRRLLQRYHERPQGRPYYHTDEWQAYGQAILQAYQETAGQPIISRRVQALERFADIASVEIDTDDLLAGSQKFCAFAFSNEVKEALCQLGYATNSGHIIHDYATLLTAGIDGVLARIATRQGEAATEDEALVLAAFARAAEAFSRFIQRHADAVMTKATGEAERAWAQEVAALAHHPPSSFRGALQMVWFTQIFLHAENAVPAISFGRLDRYLWPFLRADLEIGRLDLQNAGDLIAAFYLRCCEGEESQNLTIGGVDAEGRDATNPLSLLLLEVMRVLRVVQPSLSVRIHHDTPEEIWQAATALVATGMGQPGFMNDDAAIPGLQRVAIPLERAREYGIVGCYEAASCGDCYPITTGGGVPDLAKELFVYLHTPSAHEAQDYRVFLEGWFTHLAAVYSTALTESYQPAWDSWRDQAPSPFSSLLTDPCIERACPLEAGGARYNLYGVNILGLGTAVDSLHAIEVMVFQRQEMTLVELCAALDADFADEAVRHRLASLPGRYGADAPETNALAEEISTRVASMVLESRMAHGVRPYPGFFRFTADIWDHAYATPDGRRQAAPLSYGCGPSSQCDSAATAILSSASAVAHHLCACGNPLALSLPAADVATATGQAGVAALVRGYFARGGFHLHFNLCSAAELHAAQIDPAAYRHLQIRISGLSAQFISLDDALQEALIERAERGV